MSTPYGFCVTRQGNALLARLLSSEQLEITRVMIGEGRPAEDANLMDLETMIQPVAQATSTLPLTVGTTTSFVIEYRNDMGGELLDGDMVAPVGSGLSRDISINEFAVFARDPALGEIMLYYGCLGDYPDSVKAYSPGDPVISRRYPVSITVTNGVKIALDYAAGAYMTAEDIAEYCQVALLPKFGEIEEISGAAAPAESTVGIIGQKYTDTSTGAVYTCIAAAMGESGETNYTWVPGKLGSLADIRAALHEVSTSLSQKADVLTQNLELYVSNSGSDITGDGTETNPYATIQQALDTIPKNLNGNNIRVMVAAGTYPGFSVSGFYGGSNGRSASIKIDRVSTHSVIISGGIFVFGCKVPVEIRYINITGNICGCNIYAAHCESVSVYGCKCTGTTAPTGMFFYFTPCWCFNCTVDDKTEAGICVSGCTAYMSQIYGGGNAVCFTAGSLSTGTAGIITGDSWDITGTAKYAKIRGGIIFENGVQV